MVEDAISEPLTINVGSPQGAILSPTIFIILISDIGLYTDSTIFGYADDTTSTVSGNDIPMLVAKCEEEAKKIIDYMSINRLKANDDKTHVMMIKKGQSDEKLSFKMQHLMPKLCHIRLISYKNRSFMLITQKSSKFVV